MRRIYDNIWKIDLQSGEIESLSDFLPIEFDYHDFIEDPKQPGNFYLTGWTDKVAIHYYNTNDKSLTPVLTTDHGEDHLSISPLGDFLFFASNKSGRDELWSYDLTTQELKQISNQVAYSPAYRCHHLNWIADNEFMTAINQDGELKFAIFKI